MRNRMVSRFKNLTIGLTHMAQQVLLKRQKLCYNIIRNKALLIFHKGEFTMNIQIGENIKRLRKNKNITQEQIAEILGVSITAVSKWERGETYPDITLLFPLAHYFGVSLDELMGYNEEKIREDIKALLDEYRALSYEREFQKARELIIKAYKEYPNDYKVMHNYMWNLGGDYADNDPAVLLEHKEEFLAICNKILDGCTNENIRFDAWNMRAKILHAEGKTDEALKIYRTKFPAWYQTWEQKSEQLFAKDTPEFRRQLLLNLYELSFFAIDKKMKEIWFCGEGAAEEKSRKGLTLLDIIAEAREKSGAKELIFVEYHICNCQLNELRRFGGSEAEKALWREKRKEKGTLCIDFAQAEPVADEYIKNMYSGIETEPLAAEYNKKIALKAQQQ